MKRLKNFCLSGMLLILIQLPLMSQEESTQSLEVGSDFVSSYVWRGLLYNGSPNIQPGMYYSAFSGKFTIGAWGSFSMADPYREVDLYTSLNLGKFTLAVWDYYTVPLLGPAKYFEYGKDETNHAIEGSVVFNGFEKFPLKLTLGTFFYGNDRDLEGKNYYSTYLEAAYPFTIGKQSLNVFAGGTPSEGLYASKAAIMNFGVSLSRNINITDKFNIPVTGSLSFNPNSEEVFFVISFNLSSND